MFTFLDLLVIVCSMFFFMWATIETIFFKNQSLLTFEFWILYLIIYLFFIRSILVFIKKSEKLNKKEKDDNRDRKA